MPTKVLIIDDSALMRQMLTEMLSRDRDLEVVGAAPDPVVALDKIKKFAPDVLTLDVEMPRMDGLTFLERLMKARPMPVLMISSLTERGCATTLKALELGAVDFVTKPKIDVQQGTAQLERDIVEKVKMAARARVRPRVAPAPGQPADLTDVVVKAPVTPGRNALLQSTHKVAAIGASTGGTEALLQVLQALPPDAPGVVIVQHMPEQFTRAFADRLDRSCRIRVKEAQAGDPILPGHALIAPGNKHMRVTRSGARYSVTIDQAEPVNRHRPSVDVLFDSVAEFVGPNAVGALLTGMGRDGAKGLLTMKQAGAHTIAQNEATCVVYGMPREAVALGAAEQVLPLEQIAGGLLRMAR